MSNLFEKYKEDMIPAKELLDQTLQSMDLKTDLTSNFSELIQLIQSEAYENYKEQERRVAEVLLTQFVASNPREFFEPLNKFFLSLSQSRKSRAGSSFERILEQVFEANGYNFSPQADVDGKPDFIFPSKHHYLENAPDCIVVTAKTTLRERWRQITTEGARGKNALYLATLDKKVRKNDINEMLVNGVNLIVPKSDKNIIYKSHKNVYSYEDFVSDYLDPAVTRWNKNDSEF